MQMNPLPLRGISSMATRALLGKLCAAYAQRTGQIVQIESVGGVDAAARVQAGEALDVVLLASDAIERLIASGHAMAGSRSDWVQSPVAVAVPAGCAAPDISTPAALKAALLAAPSISYSTGPSGNYLAKLFAQWGIAQAMQAKLMVPPPGQPVGSLVASGQVALGFQQLSEMLGVPGITVVGNLPQGAAFITTFSAGIPLGVAPERVEAVRAFLSYLNAPETATTKLAHGMNPLVQALHHFYSYSFDTKKSA
jgi:molybdate transport system substrate-binding protein